MSVLTRQLRPPKPRVFLGFTMTPRVTAAWAVAGMILAVGAYATVVRFFRGLGASTALNDLAPWGIWIGFDVIYATQTDVC